jgi:hypothetical protein
VIRFLILLEIVLVALLGVRWFEAGAASRTGVTLFGTTAGGESSAAAAPAVSAPLPDQDRIWLTRDLLGAPGAGVARPASLHDLEPEQQGDTKETAAASGHSMDRALVAEAQRLLRRLGYSPGAADGVWGPRTERALDAWRRRSGRMEGGSVDAALLSQLREDVRARSAAAARRTSRGATPRHAATPAVQVDSGAQPAWISSLAGGFQRLTGREFDSRRNPQRIRDYCMVNRESWIFDEGSRNFVWCGRYPRS